MGVFFGFLDASDIADEKNHFFSANPIKGDKTHGTTPVYPPPPKKNF